MAIIYKGRCAPELYDELMDFLNYVFGFNGNEDDFKKLLPKLYKKEYDPCHSNYVVTEDGKLKAAIGAFDSVMDVRGERLMCRGIGNVAVHPYSRSKGYMKDCMNMALSDMIRDGVDMSVLGGKRQRYGYFGYDAVGLQYSISINSTNIRHVFHDSPYTEIEAKTVHEADCELLDSIYELHMKRSVYTVRPRDKFLDMARSWNSSLKALLKNGEFAGYYIGEMQELTLVDRADFNDVVRSYVAGHGEVRMRIPAWDTETIEAAMAICENTRLETCDMFNILNFKNCTGAFLKLKTNMESIADGCLTLFIHGYAGDTKIKLTVSDGNAEVTDFDGDCDLELDHKEAMQFLFGLHSPYRRSIAPTLRSWFPLPLYEDNADHV